MWLKKLFHNLFPTIQLTPTLINADYVSNRKMCEELLHELSVEHFSSYMPSNGLCISIATHYSNIEQYTQKLVEFAKYIERERIIQADWVLVQETVLSIDRFLISSDGYYLDVVKAILDFKTAGLQLCMFMERSDVELSGYYEHSLRMLTKLLINLRLVTTKLIEASAM